MPRVTLDLNTEADRQKVKGTWRRALGLVPGEPNQGLVAELEASPARLADYDDSAWEVTDNVRDLVSTAFTFGWWRITVELPEEIDGQPIAGSNLLFETNVDNYGEIWVDGDIDLVAGHSRRLQRAAACRREPKCRAGNAARDRLSGGQRPHGTTPRCDFHALRHVGLRNKGLDVGSKRRSTRSVLASS